MSKYNLSEILPHNPPMILIDDIVDMDLDGKTLTSAVTINPKMLFFDKKIDGVSSLIGIELMAQTIGCYAQLKRQEEEPRIGFLLGARLYNNAISVFKNGETYKIKVNEIFTNNKIVAFECIIYDKENTEIASATINVYQGTNAKELIKNNGQ